MIAPLMLAAIVAAAPPRPAQVAPTPSVSEVVVVVPERGALERFVDTVGAPGPGGQLGRWSEPVCVAVRGFVPAQNMALAGRVTAMAKLVSRDQDQTRCTPNVLVFATDDPDRLLQVIARRKPELFEAKYRADVRRDVTQRAPVLCFHGVVIAPADGSQLTVEKPGGSLLKNGPVNHLFSSSLIATPTKQSLVSALLVVDARQLANIPADALGDYLGMMVLAEIKNQSFAGVSTVLNMFEEVADGRTPPSSATAWDLAYLKALYELPSDSKLATQRSGIVGRFMRVRAELARRGELAKAPVSP